MSTKSEWREAKEALSALTRSLRWPSGTKICRLCKSECPFESFSNNLSRADGLQSDCKDCQSLLGKSLSARLTKRKYYLANQPELKAASNERYRSKPDEIKASVAVYREKNREAILKYQADYRKNNPETIKAALSQWYQDNKEIQLPKNRAYRKANPAKFRIYTKRYSERHPGRVRNIRRKSKNRAIESLSDGYVRSLLTSRSQLVAADIQPQFVALKRAELKVARKLKEYKNARA